MIAALLAAADPLDHVVQHTAVGFGIEGKYLNLLYFPVISNHILMQVLAGGLLVWLMPKLVAQRAGSDPIGRLVPRGFGNAIEAVCAALREHIFGPNLGRHTERFTPYLWSLFFFILACNVLGLIPLGDWFYAKSLRHQIGGTSTANFFVTGALAACTLALVVYNGLRFNGMEYVKHFFMGPWWICWFIAALEILGLFFKHMALCVRLTANMLGGHILLAVLLGFVASSYEALSCAGGTLISAAVIGASVLIYFLEILVAFLHAFIFTTLTAVFIGLAVNIQHDDHEEEHAEGAVAASH
jgi:F-type H+-transporting ATPase subunit a